MSHDRSGSVPVTSGNFPSYPVFVGGSDLDCRRVRGHGGRRAPERGPASDRATSIRNVRREAALLWHRLLASAASGNVCLARAHSPQPGIPTMRARIRCPLGARWLSTGTSRSRSQSRAVATMVGSWSLDTHSSNRRSRAPLKEQPRVISDDDGSAMHSPTYTSGHRIRAVCFTASPSRCSRSSMSATTLRRSSKPN